MQEAQNVETIIEVNYDPPEQRGFWRVKSGSIDKRRLYKQDAVRLAKAEAKECAAAGQATRIVVRGKDGRIESENRQYPKHPKDENGEE